MATIKNINGGPPGSNPLDNVAECILNIAEAQYQDVNVVDKEINFMSLIIRLLRVIK